MSQIENCDIIITADGCARMIYSELVDAFAIGQFHAAKNRAQHEMLFGYLT